MIHSYDVYEKQRIEAKNRIVVARGWKKEEIGSC